MPYNPDIHHRRSIRLKDYDYSQAGAYFITICCEDRLYRFGKVVENTMQLNEYGRIAHDEWIKLTERFTNFEMDVFQIMPNHMHGIIVLNDVLNDVTPVGATLAVALNDVVTNEKINDVGGADDNKKNDVVVNEKINDDGGVADNKKNDVVVNDNINDDVVVRAGASPAPAGPTVPAAPTVGDIVGAYKSLVANKCLEIFKSKNQIMGKFWQRNYYEHIIRDERAYQNISNYIVNNPTKWNEDKLSKRK